MTFVEDWYSPAGLMALRHALWRTRGLQGRIVEIGCWEGRSTIALAGAAWPDEVHAVDTWDGSPGEPSEQLAAERDVYATFLANIARSTAGNVTPHRMDWRDYFNQDATPVRFCHIDAAHTYTEVRDNIATVMPLIVSGGVICGDDRHHAPVAEAVRDVLGTYQFDANLWWWSNGNR